MSIKQQVEKISNPVFIAGLLILAAGIPSSRFLMSVGVIWLSAWFLITGHWTDKIRRIRANGAWILAAILLIHLIGVLYSNDQPYAFNDIRKKLPLLALPLIIGGWEPLRRSQVLWVWRIFVLTTAAFCIAVLFRSQWGHSGDFRDWVTWESHIRFSQCIALAILTLLFWSGSASRPCHPFFILTGLVLFTTLVVLQSITGWILGWIVLGYWWWRKTRKGWKYLVFLPLAAGIAWVVYFYQQKKPASFNDLPKTTVNGEPYEHDTDRHITENGHYIWLYVAPRELEREWKRRSGISLHEPTRVGYPIRAALVRYMTSKGLRKDSLGIWQLSDQDVQNVIRGINTAHPPKNAILKRLNQVMFEIDHFRSGMTPDGHSVTMRLAFWNAGWHIFCQQPWLGTGTGDIQTAFNQYYTEHTGLSKPHWRRSHNQWITFAATFGIIGLAAILLCFLLPLIRNRPIHRWTQVFLICMAVSACWEDMLENQAGITLFAFFYSLGVWQLRPKPGKTDSPVKEGE